MQSWDWPNALIYSGGIAVVLATLFVWITTGRTVSLFRTVLHVAGDIARDIAADTRGVIRKITPGRIRHTK